MNDSGETDEVTAQPARGKRAAAGTICLLVVLLAGNYFGQPLLAGLAKAGASLCFILVAVQRRALWSHYGRLIFAGLVLSWFGDVFLAGSGEAIFLAGLVSFLLAHVAYTVGFVIHGLSRRWTLGAAISLAPVVFVVLRWLIPHVDDDMRAPVFTYIAVITCMVILASGARGQGLHPSALLGAILFFLSDIAVSRNRFVEPESMDWLWGLPLYYAAQLLLAYSVGTVSRLRPEPPG